MSDDRRAVAGGGTEGAFPFRFHSSSVEPPEDFRFAKLGLDVSFGAWSSLDRLRDLWKRNLLSLKASSVKNPKRWRAEQTMVILWRMRHVTLGQSEIGVHCQDAAGILNAESPRSMPCMYVFPDISSNNREVWRGRSRGTCPGDDISAAPKV